METLDGTTYVEVTDNINTIGTYIVGIGDYVG